MPLALIVNLATNYPNHTNKFFFSYIHHHISLHPVFCHNRTEKKVPFLSNFINSVAEIVAFFIFLCVKDMILQFCSFPGVDMCPKLAHPVLSRHRHSRSLFYKFHISSLHRQTGSFQVNRQKKPWAFSFLDTTSQTSTNLLLQTGRNFGELSGLRCAFSQIFPSSCSSLSCLLSMELFTDFGRNIQQHH